MTRKIASFLVAGLLASTPASVAAQSVESRLSYDHGVQMIWDEGDVAAEFSGAPTLLTTLDNGTNMGNGRRLTYGGDVEMTGNGLATTNGANELQVGLNLGYQFKFGARDQWTYKVKGETDRLVSESEWVFQRERLGMQLSYQHGGGHTTTGMVRLGQRDQNDNRLAGYDQTEMLGQLTHRWQPAQDQLSFSGTVYAEARRADLDQYSYDEIGMRFLAKLPLSEAMTVGARTSLYQRGFQDAFSANDPTMREDTRFKATVELERDLSDKLTGDIYAGWDDNQSNVTGMEYSGAVVGVGLTYKWQ